jgi:hypothetical protein
MASLYQVQTHYDNKAIFMGMSPMIASFRDRPEQFGWKSSLTTWRKSAQYADPPFQYA